MPPLRRKDQIQHGSNCWGLTFRERHTQDPFHSVRRNGARSETNLAQDDDYVQGYLLSLFNVVRIQDDGHHEPCTLVSTLCQCDNMEVVAMKAPREFRCVSNNNAGLAS